VQMVLVQIAGVAENFPKNKVTLFFEQDRVPDRWCSGVNAIHQFDA
jgi:hypothetical protein